MGALRIFAILFGLAFIALGVAGFMPDYVTEGKLFDCLMVDQTHNLLHIITGVIALLAVSNARCAKIFFILFGLLYASATGLGLMGKEDMVMMHFDKADNIFHLVVAVIFIMIGLFFKAKEA